MSNIDKLTYLNETKRQLREAINAVAGGNLTQETPFREYAGGWLRNQSASLTMDFSKQLYVAKDKDKVSMSHERVGFEDIVTVTRATGGGRFNAQGQYEWVPSNTPRIDYDPVTGECLGLLVEEQRTNLAPHSVEVTKQYYTAFRIASRVEAIQTPVSSTASYIETDGSATNLSYFRRNVSSPEAVTISFIAKAGGVNYAYISYGSSLSVSVVFDLTTGEMTIGSNMAGSNPRMIALGGGWYRCIATVPASGSHQYIGVSATNAPVGYPVGVGGIYITGIQFEEGSFPTSYIPTEGAQVTRAADTASVSELSPWYNPEQGSFSIKSKGHIGEPLLTAGDVSIISDSNELKEYQVSYSGSPQATQVTMGKGLVESIRYWPREIA